ncbi:MAG TPA: CapA family protein [Terriglobia bacterium]|nr:CapA family protein [Terriglobia bacterium]
MTRPLLAALCLSLTLAAALKLGAARTTRQSPAGPAAAQAPGAPATPATYTLLFVGDLMLSRTVGKKMEAESDWEWPFRLIDSRLQAADFVFGNLECPVSDVGRNLHHLYSFRADPRALDGLKEAGFKAVSVANNHMDDWDRPALLDTVRRLRDAGIVPVGAGADEDEARQAQIVDFPGLRLALLAYVGVEPQDAAAGPKRAGVAWLDPDAVLEDVRAARSRADLVIVSLHWGAEYARRPSAEQVKLAHDIIDAGADLVVGAHPHVIEPLERYHEGWVAYSLGNFVFDQHDLPTHHGMMLQVTVIDKAVAGVTPVPILIGSSFQPAIDLKPAPSSLPALWPAQPQHHNQPARAR